MKNKILRSVGEMGEKSEEEKWGEEIKKCGGKSRTS